LAQVHHTTSQYNLPESGKQIADKANRDGVAARFAAPAVHKTIAVDLALITSYDELLKALDLSILQPAKHHEAQTLSLLQTGPGIGTILSLVLLDDIHEIARFASVPDVVSSWRLVTCAQASAGKRVGTSGKKIGHVHLTWAVSEAATLCLRTHAAAQSSLARFEKTQGTGTAWTLLAHKLARAVYYMRKRQTAFDMERCLHG
jgi:transposase